MIFAVSGDLSKIEKIQPGSFVDLQVWERRHIQEWVREHPEILGEDLLIVSTEFDRFQGSRDRLDLLAVDRGGNLVVVELKRDPTAGHADLQALRYAAMVSTMTVERLLPYYADYHRKTTGEDASEETLKAKLVRFVDVDDFEELSDEPRIVLCSEGFSQEITTTVLWLRRFGLDVSCVRLTPYRLDEKIVLVPERIIPLKETEQYVTGIREKEEKRQESKQRNPYTMPTLINNGLLKEGVRIYLKSRLPWYMEYDENDPTYHAVVTGKLGQSDAVRWEADGREYSVTGLTKKIFQDLHPEQKSPSPTSGTDHWTDREGVSLYELAKRFIEEAI